MLHDRQVAAVRKAMIDVRPQRVLEIAPGPARLSRELCSAFDGRGVLVDASWQMLSEARRQLRGSNRWLFVQGDAFTLPFTGHFDLVYSFRLIRHFEATERLKLYRQVVARLRPGGLFLFDAVNADVSLNLRRGARPEEYQHFDALLREPELRAEVAAAGLEVVSLEQVQRRYKLLSFFQIYVAPRSAPLARWCMEITDKAPGGMPLEWIAVCRRP
jgi:SAM-dependent methyltransferase